MNLGSSAADLGLVVLLLFPALLAPALLVGGGVLAARVLRLPWAFAALFALGAAAALLLAGSLYLDGAGRTVEGLVERRGEAVELRRQGDWRHSLSVSVRYSQGGAAAAGAPSPDDSATTLRPTPAQFDALREGGPVSLRVVPLFRSLALVRLAGTSTLDSIPWGWGLAALAALLFILVARRLMATNLGGALLVLAVVVGGAGLPLALAYGRWQASEDLAARPLRATAEVLAVTRVTEVDPFPCRPGGGSRCERRSARFAVAQPYDIVELGFVPEGAAGPVIAVDAVDAGGAELRPGANLAIAYGPGEARAAQILGAQHTHHWRNALGIAAALGAMGALVAGLLWGAVRLAGRARRRAPAP